MNFVAAAALCAILSSGFFAAGASGQDTVYGVCEKACGYLDAGQFDLAIEQFNEALKADPACAYAYLLRSTAYFGRFKAAGKPPGDSSDFNNAMADLDTSLTLDRDLAVSYQARAGMFELMKDYEKAVADCTRAIELYSATRPNPYLDLLYGQGRFDNKKELAQAYYIRGSCYAKLHMLDDALSDMDQAHEYDPQKELYPQEKERIERLRGAIEKVRQMEYNKE